MVSAASSCLLNMRTPMSPLSFVMLKAVDKEAISIAGNIESFIEIKRMRSGIIARVYLINAKERAAAVHKSISRRIEQCDLKKYLWVMQMTDMPAASSLSEMQKKLNEQLIEELLRRRKGDRG